MQRLGDFVVLTVAALTLALTTTAAEELRSVHFLDQTYCKNDIFEKKIGYAISTTSISTSTTI